MVIEQLTFRIPTALRARFLALDAEIWTATLAAQPGYLGKEVWAEAASPDTLHLIIRWQSRAEWKAVPADILAETDARMTAAMGQPCPVLLCTDCDVLRPPLILVNESPASVSHNPAVHPQPEA
jgi:uncharacterized protein (TIGR03792 family)